MPLTDKNRNAGASAKMGFGQMKGFDKTQKRLENFVHVHKLGPYT